MIRRVWNLDSLEQKLIQQLQNDGRPATNVAWERRRSSMQRLRAVGKVLQRRV